LGPISLTIRACSRSRSSQNKDSKRLNSQFGNKSSSGSLIAKFMIYCAFNVQANSAIKQCNERSAGAVRLTASESRLAASSGFGRTMGCTTSQRKRKKTSSGPSRISVIVIYAMLPYVACGISVGNLSKAALLMQRFETEIQLHRGDQTMKTRQEQSHPQCCAG